MSSGEYGTIYTKGMFLFRAGEAIQNGQVVEVKPETDDEEVITGANYEKIVGRAYSSTDSTDAYIVVLIRI